MIFGGVKAALVLFRTSFPALLGGQLFLADTGAQNYNVYSSILGPVWGCVIRCYWYHSRNLQPRTGLGQTVLLRKYFTTVVARVVDNSQLDGKR